MQGIDAKKTGKRMKEICRRRNVSVKDIQEELFIGSFQAVYAWFSGKSLPSLDNLYRLSRLLNVPMDWLIVGQWEKYLRAVQYVNAENSFDKIFVIKQKTIQYRILAYYLNIRNTAAS